MENIKLMMARKPDQEFLDNDPSASAATEYKLSEIEKLRRSHNKIFAEISNSYVADPESSEIDELLAERGRLLSEMASAQKQCDELRQERTSRNIRQRIHGELLHILSGIHSLRASRSKREEVMTASIESRKKQEVNSEIVEAKRMEQRECLEDKLKDIEQELEEFTNLNKYGSPSVSVRGSLNLKDLHFETLSVASDASQLDANQMKENKQSIHSVIQYLQDFLPLTMRKQIETLKMKAMSDGNEQEIENVVMAMTVELQSMRPGGEKEGGRESGCCHWYLNHNMTTFDEFDALDIRIPLILCDIPSVIKTLLDRIRSIQIMNKCFAIV